jgi:hypothetical protein
MVENCNFTYDNKYSYDFDEETVLVNAKGMLITVIHSSNSPNFDSLLFSYSQW